MDLASKANSAPEPDETSNFEKPDFQTADVFQLAEYLDRMADAYQRDPPRLIWQDRLDREYAARALARMGPAAAPAIPALIRTLRSLRSRIRLSLTDLRDSSPLVARDALVKIGPAAAPALREALRNEDPPTRIHAARALWQLDKDPDEVLPVLWKAWHNPKLFDIDGCAPLDATEALVEIGRVHKDRVFPVFVESVNTHDRIVAYYAVSGLAQLAPQFPEATTALVSALRNGRVDLKGDIANALAELGPTGLPGLLAVLRDGNLPARAQAARALGRYKAQEIVANLVQALADESKDVRFWAINSIACIGPPATAALPALERMLRDPDEDVRSAAQRTLNELRDKNRQLASGTAR
jgi:HEAT repeat protein